MISKIKIIIFSRKLYFEYFSNIYVITINHLFVATLDVYHFYLQQTHSVNTSFVKINVLQSTVTPIYVTGNYYQSISLVTPYKYIISLVQHIKIITPPLLRLKNKRLEGMKEESNKYSTTINNELCDDLLKFR